MTSDILDYLNGNILYGMAIIPFLGVIFTMIWWVAWRGTGFWGIGRFWRVLLIGWLAIVSGYTVWWRTHPPAPIPIRVFVRAGDGTGQSPGAWAEGVADVIRTRLRVAPEPFTVQDEESARILFETSDQSRLDSIAKLMRVKYLVMATQDESDTSARPPVKVTIRGWSKKTYKTIAELSSPNVGLASLSAWAAEAVAQKLGGIELKGSWAGRPPNLPDSLLEVHYLAFSLRRRGENDLAAALFMVEAEEDTNWSAPRVEFARTWLRSKPDLHEDDIRRLLLEAASFDRENPEIYILLGKHFLEFRDWEEAESALKLAYNLDREDPRIYLYLSRLMESRLDNLPIKSGRAMLERALMLAPAYDAARLGLVEKMRAVNERRQALIVLDEGLRIDPNSRSLLITASAIRIEMHEYQIAAALCERLLGNDPRDHEALYNLGLCRLWLKEYDEAIAMFDSSRNNGGSVENLYYCGVANQFKGDYPAAISWFQKRFAAAQRQDDEGAAAARARIGMLRDWIIEDSLKQSGWKPDNPFDKPPKAKDLRK